MGGHTDPLPHCIVLILNVGRLLFLEVWTKVLIANHNTFNNDFALIFLRKAKSKLHLILKLCDAPRKY